MASQVPTIGLFGTCGRSTFRDDWIRGYKNNKIQFFNPQKGVGEWKEEDALEEAHHLANDEIILFPITSEEYSLGSLSEVGFSILNAIRLDERRDFVVYIANEINKDLEDQALRKESLRARALVKEHLRKLNLANLYVVNSLAEMYALSVELYAIATMRANIAKFKQY